MQRKNPQTSQPKPVWDHVKDLQSTAIICVLLSFFSAGITHAYHQNIIAYMLKPLGNQSVPLQFLSPLEPLFFILKIDLFGALLISLPFILLSLYHYVAQPRLGPLLQAFGIVLISYLFGAVGASYAYYVVVPIVLEFMNSLVVPGTVNSFTAMGFLNFLITTALLLVFVFQIPIITVTASYLQIINPQQFTYYRRNIYLGILVMTAVITPTTDVITLFLISLPTVLVTELGILFGKYAYKIRGKNTPL